MKDRLLEYIFDNSQAMYISDMRSPMILANSLEFIDNISDEQFTLEEWNTFNSYIHNKKTTLNSIEECKVAIHNFVK